MNCEINNYMPDEFLAMCWKYAKPDLGNGQKSTYLGDLLPANYEVKMAINYIAEFLTKLAIKPNQLGVVLYDLDGSYSSSEEKFNLIDLASNEDPPVPNGIFYINNNTPQKDRKKIIDHLHSYIEKYIKNELIIDKSNYYNFEKQKECFIKKIYDQNFIEKYGSDFVLKNSPSVDKEFLFTHTIMAFELFGYIKVNKFWHENISDKVEYSANITVLGGMYNEIKEYVKNLNLDKSINRGLFFDADKSRFYVYGEEIKLLKFKDEYHTLRIIFEDRTELSKEWFFSEIRERVDKYSKDDKKYYNAIYQLKAKLEKRGIKDFFITTKQSVKINSKYLS